MCTFLTNSNYLGQRLIGFDCYDSKSKGFIGMSEKQIIDKIKRGERVYGFKLGKEDDKEVLVLDSENFNMINLQVKSGVNTLSWMNEMDANDINTALIAVAVKNENGNKVYETVNARHARVTYNESKLLMMMEIGIPVAGIKLDKKNNKIVVCDGVEIEQEAPKAEDKKSAGKVEEPKAKTEKE